MVFALTKPSHASRECIRHLGQTVYRSSAPDAYTKDNIANKSTSLLITSAQNRVSNLALEAFGGSSRETMYNTWSKMGQSQWDYDKSKDCFTRSENSLNRDEDHHGKDEPWMNRTFSGYASRGLRHGIGPEDHLKKHGIKTVVHSPGVGFNMEALGRDRGTSSLPTLKAQSIQFSFVHTMSQKSKMPDHAC
ncbi:hypothetical protein M422DRAFT_273651 [Sphaerobolus stellatus SS14]|uniref:Unplaced genomic scaffold SPHSTscaffold_342, whole genome shotgun sequence n=1 Tax=Sphaerobolus stellatus (strain SS14) TaxID=990650 RepID=A0A0C9UJN1_SPHS4|nr:hypothetical protein M422DRAFT_273651 [Sphaerobolus stellatus SS14]